MHNSKQLIRRLRSSEDKSPAGGRQTRKRRSAPAPSAIGSGSTDPSSGIQPDAHQRREISLTLGQLYAILGVLERSAFFAHRDELRSAAIAIDQCLSASKTNAGPQSLHAAERNATSMSQFTQRVNW